jgi:signal transduction histidine kinase
MRWQVYAFWLVAIVVSELITVPVWGSVVLAMSLPLVLAVGMVFSPLVAGALAFIGSVDVRELRGDVSLARALYNRSQVMLSAILASIVFHGLGGRLESWPTVLLISGLVVCADFLTNAVLVSFPIHLDISLSLASIVRRIIGDSPKEHVLGHASLGLLALPLAILWQAVGAWAFVAFLAPLFLVRQMFAHGKRLDAASRIVHSKNRALASAAKRVVDERRDERLIVAGGLHDEVMQPLYKVHLMGQVLRHDLDSGRLLDLDSDLPQLVDATNAAQVAIRNLVGHLRKSALGPDGLVSTLGLLVRDLSSESSTKIELHAEEVGGAATTQLLAYQVVQEALTNAIRHANASRISVSVSRVGDQISVVVQDDGQGFRPDLVDGAEHFGLQIMGERVDSGGGKMRIDSAIGLGTCVSALMPAEGAWRV